MALFVTGEVTTHGLSVMAPIVTLRVPPAGIVPAVQLTSPLAWPQENGTPTFGWLSWTLVKVTPAGSASTNWTFGAGFTSLFETVMMYVTGWPATTEVGVEILEIVRFPTLSV